MGLFSKKNCDICGGKIGMLGNRKLDDGNMCKDCAAKLSPFITDRKRTTMADINEHLNYREENKEEVAKFNPTRTIGDKTKVIFDEDAAKFIVTSSTRWKSENPDVMTFSQVTGCNTEIKETKTEQRMKDKEGKMVSFVPPRYTYDYDFNVKINVNSPYFSEITFKLNNNRVDRNSIAFREFEKQAAELKQVLTEVRQEVRQNVVAANTPKTVQLCPQCGATSIPDTNGRCEFCGGAMNV
jgi:hypothetical protein